MTLLTFQEGQKCHEACGCRGRHPYTNRYIGSPKSGGFFSKIGDAFKHAYKAVKSGGIIDKGKDALLKIAKFARHDGPEWCRGVAGLCAGTGHLFLHFGGLPAQNFASVAKGKHRKILTGSWQPLVSLETC